MTAETITARGHTFSANLRVVKKRFNPRASTGCILCGGLNHVTTYTVQPKELLDHTTDWNAGVRKATWRLLPAVSMNLCDDCIREHSRFKIGNGVLQIFFCAGLAALCAWLTNINFLTAIQWLFKFVGVISLLGILTGLIDILFTLSGARKNKRPQSGDGRVCVKDLIEPLYEGHKFKIDL